MNKYKLLNEHQFGFQKSKSTEYTFPDLYSNLNKAIENQWKPSRIFLNFAKVSDTANHDTLIGKLEHYGIRGTALSSFKFYLDKRTQTTNW